MINIQYILIAFLFVGLSFPYIASSQTSSIKEPGYEVYRIYAPISITKERVSEAQTLVDLDANYQSSWIKEYILVEVLTSYEGKILKAAGKNDTLTQEQKDIMNLADAGTDIRVEVQYIPENSLVQNDPKKLDFAFTVEPESEAKYAEGPQQLKQYLKDQAIDKIPKGSFKELDLAAIKFTINEYGQVSDAYVFDPVYQASGKERINELLLEAIRNMPDWKPAEYADGTRVKQEFVLTVGDMENCVVNLLNIHQD
jgi:hypothetical protein